MNDKQKMLDQTLFLLAHNNVITRQTHVSYKEMVELLRECLEVIQNSSDFSTTAVNRRVNLIDALRERLE
jgi:DNA-binding HxlR family transcriptional regulator